MSKVLLTGGRGFIGSSVLAALVNRGHVVHVVSRVQASNIHVSQIHWHTTDLFDQAAVTELFDIVHPDVLIHLSWDTSHGSYWHTASNLSWLTASLSLVQDFARVGGKKILLAGSSAEYQWGSLENLKEYSSLLAPDSLYGISKLALFNMVTKWAATEGISVAWLRFFNVFGPRERPERLIPRVICSLLDSQEVRFDAAHSLRDFMHVDDVGEAVAALLDSSVQGAVNIASGQATSIRHVLNTIANYLQKEKFLNIGAEPNLDFDPIRIVADTGRLREEVGWFPKISLEHRLNETCEWWLRIKRQY